MDPTALGMRYVILGIALYIGARNTHRDDHCAPRQVDVPRWLWLVLGAPAPGTKAHPVMAALQLLAIVYFVTGLLDLSHWLSESSAMAAYKFTTACVLVAFVLSVMNIPKERDAVTTRDESDSRPDCNQTSGKRQDRPHG